MYDFATGLHPKEPWRYGPHQTSRAVLVLWALVQWADYLRPRSYANIWLLTLGSFFCTRVFSGAQLNIVPTYSSYGSDSRLSSASFSAWSWSICSCDLSVTDRQAISKFWFLSYAFQVIVFQTSLKWRFHESKFFLCQATSKWVSVQLPSWNASQGPKDRSLTHQQIPSVNSPFPSTRFVRSKHRVFVISTDVVRRWPHGDANAHSFPDPLQISPRLRNGANKELVEYSHLELQLTLPLWCLSKVRMHLRPNGPSHPTADGCSSDFLPRTRLPISYSI